MPPHPAQLPPSTAPYRETLDGTIAALERFAAQLEHDPTDAAVLSALQRLLGRVAGSAGTYGLMGVSLLASGLDQLVREWAIEPTCGTRTRGRVVLDGARAIAALLGDQADEPEVSPVSEEGPACSTSAAAPAGETPGPAPATLPSAPAPPRAEERLPDVVIVEDEPGMTALLEFGMRQIGLEPIAFSTGAEAFEALRRMPAGGGRPLVLLDVELPGLDGHAIQERLEAERPGAFTFVFASGRSSDGEQVRALAGGALDYLTKPLNLRILMAKIPRWLALSGQRAA